MPRQITKKGPQVSSEALLQLVLIISLLRFWNEHTSGFYALKTFRKPFLRISSSYKNSGWLHHTFERIHKKLTLCFTAVRHPRHRRRRRQLTSLTTAVRHLIWIKQMNWHQGKESSSSSHKYWSFAWISTEVSNDWAAILDTTSVNTTPSSGVKEMWQINRQQCMLPSSGLRATSGGILTRKTQRDALRLVQYST